MGVSRRFLLAVVLLLSSFGGARADVTIHVDRLPWYTPSDREIFLIGEFDALRRRETHRLWRDADGGYYVVLRSTEGTYRVSLKSKEQWFVESGARREFSALSSGDTTIDVRVTGWVGYWKRFVGYGLLALSLVISMVVALVVYWPRKASPAVLPIPEFDHCAKSAALSAAVASLTTQTRELERWSRALER